MRPIYVEKHDKKKEFELTVWNLEAILNLFSLCGWTVKQTGKRETPSFDKLTSEVNKSRRFQRRIRSTYQLNKPEQTNGKNETSRNCFSLFFPIWPTRLSSVTLPTFRSTQFETFCRSYCARFVCFCFFVFYELLVLDLLYRLNYKFESTWITN